MSADPQKHPPIPGKVTQAAFSLARDPFLKMLWPGAYMAWVQMANICRFLQFVKLPLSGPANVSTMVAKHPLCHPTPTQPQSSSPHLLFCTSVAHLSFCGTGPYLAPFQEGPGPCAHPGVHRGCGAPVLALSASSASS